METRTQERDQQGFWRELLDFVLVLYILTHVFALLYICITGNLYHQPRLGVAGSSF